MGDDWLPEKSPTDDSGFQPLDRFGRPRLLPQSRGKKERTASFFPLDFRSRPIFAFPRFWFSIRLYRTRPAISRKGTRT